MTGAEAGVVGSGRVGLSLAAALRDSGAFDEVWVAGRRVERPQFLRGREGVGYGVRDRWLRELPDRPTEELFLFFCVPDGAVADAARHWGRGLAAAGILDDTGTDPGPTLRAAFHTSGLRPASELAPLADAAGGDGPPVASLHPLCAVARPDTGAFRGVTFGVEGEEAAVEIAVEIAETLGRRALRVSSDGKARYHAGAVFASNFVAACIGAGFRQLEEATGGEASADDLLPLARSAVEQVARHGPEEGTTGPVLRGDIGTVEAHLGALDPATRSLYASLTAELLRREEVSPRVRRAVGEMLESISAPDGDPRPDPPPGTAPRRDAED